MTRIRAHRASGHLSRYPATTRPATFRRRDFLKLMGAAAGAAAAYPLLGRPAMAAEKRSPIVKVLLEDVHLRAHDLSAGGLDGVVATARGISLLPGRERGVYTSPILTTRAPFTHVGVQWNGEAAARLSFEVRSSGDGRAWSNWEAVLIEAHTADEAQQGAAGALVSADRATRVQFRTVFEDRGNSVHLEDATVTLINSKDGPTTTAWLDASSTLPALTSGGQVFSREGWGADDSVRFDSNGSELWPRMFLPVKKVAVHHTATSNRYDTVDDAKAEVRAIYAYHAVSLGWGDIGYNHLVDKFGNVYEGRYGRDLSGREAFSPGVVAGHAITFNYGSCGTAYLGTCTKGGEGGRPGTDLSPNARTAVVDMLAWECDRHDIDPEGINDFLLSDDNWDRSQPNIAGHRDCQGSSTICPGGYIYDQLPSLRTDVAARLQDRKAATVVLEAPSVDTASLDAVSDLQFNWGGTGSISMLLEGWRRKLNADGTVSEDVDYVCGFDSNDDGVDDAEPYPDWDPTDMTSATFGQLFDLFAGAGAGPVPGHYTFHVLATDAAGNVSFQRDHTLLVTDGGDGGGGGSDGISLSATGHEVQGGRKVELAWSGATSTNIDVYRDGAKIATTANDGFHTDEIKGRSSASYTYKVAEAGTANFSNEATVIF